MVQQVEVDGEIHEFPDEATPDMMKAALKKEAARQQFVNLTQNGILDRPMKRLGEDALSMVKGLGSTVAEGVPATLNRLVTHPADTLKQAGAGLSGIPFSIMNTLLNVPQYVAHLESDKASDFLKKYTPEIPVDAIVSANWGEATPAQQKIRNLASIAPVLFPAAKMGVRGTVGAVKGVGGRVLGKTDPVLAANEALLDTQLGAKESELGQKTAAAQAAEEAHKEAIAQSKQQVGKSDADLMTYNVTNRQKAIQDLTEQNEALRNQLAEVKPKEGEVDQAQAKLLAKQEAQLKALQEAEANDQAYSAAIEQSKQQTGKSSPDLMENAAQKRQQDIDSLMSEANDLQEQLNATKVSEEEIPKAEENLNASQLHQQHAESMADNINANIGQFLNEGAQHDVRAAQGLSNRVNAIEDYWNNAYKTFTSNIADANFQMPKTAMDKLDYDKMSPSQLIQTFGADAFEALKAGKLDDFIKKQKIKDVKEAKGTNPYLQTLMEVAPTITDTNAADFLAKYKDFRDRTFKLSQRLRDPRVEEVEKQKMQEALKQGREMQVQMKEVLDAGLGEFKPEFERVNKGYSEQVYPLRENPVVQNAHEGKLPDNIMKALRTNQEGMPLVRDIVKQDPELMRNIIGQRYFSGKTGREAIHNPNEMVREYLDEMPQLKRLLNERQTAQEALDQAKENAKMAQQQHAEITKRHAESKKIESNLTDLHEKIEKSQKELASLQKNIDSLKTAAQKKNISLDKKVKLENELAQAKAEHAELLKRQNEAEKIDKKIKDLSDDIDKHSLEIPKLQEHIERLQETAKRKNISLKEKMQTEKELKELRRQLRETSTKLDQKTTGLKKYLRAAKLIYRGGKFITTGS